ncbi:MAG: hypothetical protein AAGN66_04920 [Acidobacteriota bacterium]
MSELKIEFETAKSSMDEIRPHLEAALKKQFPGGLLKQSWADGALELSGPGAQGSIRVEAGKLVGTATLRPPASMMRAVIEEKISAAMQEAAGA